MAEHARERLKLNTSSDVDANSQRRGESNELECGCVAPEMGYCTGQLSYFTSEEFSNGQQANWLERLYDG